MVKDLLTERKDEKLEKGLISIRESEIVNELVEKSGIINNRIQVNYALQDNRDRLDKVKESIDQHGYPYESKYIVLSENGKYIIDGCHRASYLYCLDHDAIIPVIRWHSKSGHYDDTNKQKELFDEYINKWWKEYEEKMKSIYISQRKKLEKQLLLKCTHSNC